MNEGRIFEYFSYEPLMRELFEVFRHNQRVMLPGTTGVDESLFFGLLFLRALIRRLRAIQNDPKVEEHASWLKRLGGHIVYERERDRHWVELSHRFIRYRYRE